MPRVPIFLSSTFNDFQAERDILTTEVLPRINEELRPFGHEAFAIDLRWGVDTADLEISEAMERVAEVCLGEIERSKPMFVGLVGDRYGWQPPDMLALRLIEQMGASPPGRTLSITEIEFESGAFADDSDPLIMLRSVDGTPPPNWVDTDQTAIRRFRRRIADSGLRIATYVAEVDQTGLTPVGRSDFAQFAYRELTDLVSSRLKGLSEPESPHAASVDLWMESRTRVFVGRDEFVTEVERRLDETRRVCLLGPPGSGKSAVWSAVIERRRRRGATVLCDVLGLAAGRDTEQRVVSFLLEGLGQTDRSPDKQSRRLRFWDALRRHDDLVVAVDALDRLGRGERDDVAWITAIGEHGTVLCSTNDEAQARIFRRAGFEVIPIPDLSASDRSAIAHGLLADRARSAPARVLDQLGAKSTSPLWTELAVTELLSIGEQQLLNLPAGSEPIADLLDRYATSFPSDTEGLIAEVLGRLEREIGRDRVATVLLGAAIARSPLTVDELSAAVSVSSIDVATIRRRGGALVGPSDPSTISIAHATVEAVIARRYASEVPRAHTLLSIAFDERGADGRSDAIYHAIAASDLNRAGEHIDQVDGGEALRDVHQGMVDALLDAVSDEAGAAIVNALAGDRQDRLVWLLDWLASESAQELHTSMRRALAETLHERATAASPAWPPMPTMVETMTGLAKLKSLRLSRAEQDFYELLRTNAGAARATAIAARADAVLGHAMQRDGSPQREVRTHMLRSLLKLREVLDMQDLIDQVGGSPLPDHDRHATRAAFLDVLEVQLDFAAERGRPTPIRAELDATNELVAACRNELMRYGPGSSAHARLISTLALSAQQLLAVGQPDRAGSVANEALALADSYPGGRPFSVEVARVRAWLVAGDVALSGNVSLEPNYTGRVSEQATQLALSATNAVDVALLQAWSFELHARDTSQRDEEGRAASSIARRAIDICESLLAEDDQRTDVRAALVSAHNTFSVVERRTGNLSSAQRAAGQAARVRKQTHRTALAPQTWREARDSAVADSALGQRLLRFQSRNETKLRIAEGAERAEKLIHDGERAEAAALLCELLDALDQSTSAERWNPREATEYEIGLLEFLDETVEGRADFERSLGHRQREVAARRRLLDLTKKRKQIAELRGDLALAQARLASRYASLDMNGEASGACADAADTLLETIRAQADDYDYRGALAHVLHLANVALESSPNTVDADQTERLVRAAEQAVSEHGVAATSELAPLLRHHSRYLHDAQRFADAVAPAQRAVQLADELCERERSNEHLMLRTRVLSRLSIALGYADREAAVVATRSLAAAEELVQSDGSLAAAKQATLAIDVVMEYVSDVSSLSEPMIRVDRLLAQHLATDPTKPYSDKFKELRATILGNLPEAALDNVSPLLARLCSDDSDEDAQKIGLDILRREFNRTRADSSAATLREAASRLAVSNDVGVRHESLLALGTIASSEAAAGRLSVALEQRVAIRDLFAGQIELRADLAGSEATRCRLVEDVEGPAAAIEAATDFANEFDGDDDPAVRESVGWALLRRARLVAGVEGKEAAERAYEDIAARRCDTPVNARIAAAALTALADLIEGSRGAAAAIATSQRAWDLAAAASFPDGTTRSDALLGHAYRIGRLEGVAAADPTFQKVIELLDGKSDPESLWAVDGARFERAVCSILGGEHASAFATLRAIATSSPSGYAAAAAAPFLLLLGEFELAEQAYRHAADLYPDGDRFAELAATVSEAAAVGVRPTSDELTSSSDFKVLCGLGALAFHAEGAAAAHAWFARAEASRCHYAGALTATAQRLASTSE